MRSSFLALVALLALAPPVAEAADGWADPVTLSAAGDGAGAARVAIGSQGQVAVTWRAAPAGTDPASGRIQASVRAKGATGFGAAADQSGLGVSGTAALAFSPLGEAVAAWSATAGHGFPYAVATALLPSGAGAFGGGPDVDTGLAPAVAFDGVGNGVLVWTDRIDGRPVVHAAARQPNSYAFDSPGLVSSAAVSASAPLVAFDAAGNATVAWIVTGPAPAVQVSTRLAGGTFAAPHTISAGPEPVASSLALAGGGGGVTVAWLRSDGVVRAVTGTGTGTFSAPQTLATGAVGELDAARGADGTSAVGWAAGDAAHVAVLRMGGGSFGADVTLGAGGAPRLAVASTGSVLAAWPGEGSTPRVAWIDPLTGAPGAAVDLGPAESPLASIGDATVGPDDSAAVVWSAGIPPSARVRVATRPGTAPLPPDAEQPTDTGEDDDGGEPAGPPSLSRFGLSQGAFYAARRGATIATGTGTTIKWTLDRAATTYFRVEQAVGGRRVNGRCRRDTGRWPRRPRCVIVKRIGEPFWAPGRQDFNTARFSGRIGGRALRPGYYRLAAYAKDAGGRSPTARAAFQIVRR